MLSLFGEFGYLNRFKYTFKKFFAGTPVQFNGQPVATWKLLLPLLVIALIIPLLFVVKEATRPPTPDEIAQMQYQKAKQQADTLSQKIAKQTSNIPTDETPNVATITDVNQLQNQVFFKVAKNGDKLLIYEKKKIIVLYRPSEDKVIATAPVLYNQPATQVAGTSSAQ